MLQRSKPILVGVRAEARATETNNSAAHPVLQLPARAVASLPEAITLWLHVPGAPATVCLSTARAALEIDQRDFEQDAVARLQSEPHQPSRELSDTIVFDGAELDALVLAAEADRLWHPEFLGLCFEKWRSGVFRVREHEVLAGANPDDSVTWTLAQVLERLGASIECVAFDADVRHIAEDGEEHAHVARGLHIAA
jgi:hypothetical protein